MKSYVTTGLTVLAGVALFEAALIPAVVVGGAAVLAPKYLPVLRRRLRPIRNGKSQRRPAEGAHAKPRAEAPVTTLAGIRIGRTIAKTITFRLIVTTLDFTTNYVVIGELTTAAGLSTFNLIAGPLFYLGHEAAWNYLGEPEDASIEVQLPWSSAGARKLRVSRALAKTITFRTIATVVDFTANYVVVGDALTAVGLSAFGFVLGPFVYFGHEKLWDYYSSPANTGAGPSSAKLLPAPA
jgi:uncharacterized membrane protein